MLEIKQIGIFGWEAAIHGMRNPLNSWDLSDSPNLDMMFFDDDPREFIGENDTNLMKRLAAAGTDHRKFMRMITVYLDITAPLYWWKEFDTYKVGTVANSCSTMHKLIDRDLTLEDFSHEHLLEVYEAELCATISEINKCRVLYSQTSDKIYWWQMIQLLPSSYNQKRTVMLNYEVLANIYKSRKSHKLDEWLVFCDWIRRLPYAELITGVYDERYDRRRDER